MKRLTFLFIFSILTFSISNAQNRTVDSILLTLKSVKHDTTKLNILLNLIESITDDKVWPKLNDEAYKLADKLSQSENEKIKTKGKKGLADALNSIAYLKQLEGDIQNALMFYEKSLKLYQDIGFKYCLVSWRYHI